jgi:hypothetical protein
MGLLAATGAVAVRAARRNLRVKEAIILHEFRVLLDIVPIGWLEDGW